MSIDLIYAVVVVARRLLPRSPFLVVALFLRFFEAGERKPST